jgi:hypothetical protein
VVTEELTNKVRSLLATLRRWAQGKPEIVAVGLVGSWVATPGWTPTSTWCC